MPVWDNTAIQIFLPQVQIKLLSYFKSLYQLDLIAYCVKKGNLHSSHVLDGMFGKDLFFTKKINIQNFLQKFLLVPKKDVFRKLRIQKTGFRDGSWLSAWNSLCLPQHILQSQLETLPGLALNVGDKSHAEGSGLCTLHSRSQQGVSRHHLDNQTLWIPTIFCDYILKIPVSKFEHIFEFFLLSTISMIFYGPDIMPYFKKFILLI